MANANNKRKVVDRRKVERRAPKRGVTIRIDDDEKQPPRRVTRYGK